MSEATATLANIAQPIPGPAVDTHTMCKLINDQGIETVRYNGSTYNGKPATLAGVIRNTIPTESTDPHAVIVCMRKYDGVCPYRIGFDVVSLFATREFCKQNEHIGLFDRFNEAWKTRPRQSRPRIDTGIVYACGGCHYGPDPSTTTWFSCGDTKHLAHALRTHVLSCPHVIVEAHAKPDNKRKLEPDVDDAQQITNGDDNAERAFVDFMVKYRPTFPRLSQIARDYYASLHKRQRDESNAKQ
jgi:hypothetical protein